MKQQDQTSRIGIWPLLVLLGQVIAGWRARRTYEALPEVMATEKQALAGGLAWPGISVIIPARNEETNLPRLLDSLVVQDYPAYEVIVVDDASTDATAAIARRYADRGVQLIQTDGPPPGWTGKNAACWRGARESHHPWLLFVDADTTLAPLALRSTIAFALDHHAEALSLFARQHCETFWEKLLLPFAYQHYFTGVNVRRIHSAAGPALANGQYFLINREAYQRANGHAANAQSIIDDVALAGRLKQVGVIPLACRGESLVSVRMYANLKEIMAGFGKNAYLFLRQSPSGGVQTALSTTLAAAVGVLFLDAWRKRSWRLLGIAVLAYCTQVLSARSWLRRFGVPMRYALLTPLAALSFLTIALNSLLRTLIGRPSPWKGRIYRPYQTVHVPCRVAGRWLVGMGRAMLFRTPRSIVEDSKLSVSVLPQSPSITGLEHIPQEGSFVLVSNHYQRLNLWIGWSGTVLIDAIASKRDMATHVITTDRAHIGRFTVPGTRWLFERVATVWDLVLVRPRAMADGPRYPLLRVMRLLKRDDGKDVCILLMPEGDEGNTHGLIDAVPGSGRALAALSARGLPLVPAAIWDSAGRFSAHFGEPCSLTALGIGGKTDDELVREMVMQRIAALLPPELRGRYGSILDGTLG